MKTRRRAPKRVRGAARSAARREWIGGRLSPPFFIHDRKEPYRPEMVVWMELPSELVVANEVFDPADAEGMVARGLLSAMKHPLAGPPRRPDTIRVADASLAAEVQAAIGSAIPVVVAPTPELDDLLRLMIDSMPGPEKDGSYLEGGRIAPAKVKALFAAAEILYRIAPWKVATDAQVLRMDIPALSVDGACVSIIGQLGHSRGVMVFPSHAGYEAFLRAAEEHRPRRGPVDLGTGWLALSFDPGADLPLSMRREVRAHAWPVAGEDAYPRVERRDSDGASRPLVDRDLKIAAACATSLSTFFLKHRKRFEVDELEPVCESYFDEDDLEVRFTLPYEAFPLFDVDEAPALRTAPPAGADRPKVGRNAPCPCGSGRKYKKCHLPLDEQERPARGDSDAHHDLDAHLVHELTNFAETRFGDEWLRFERDFADASEEIQLSRPWSVYGYEVQGATVLEWYLEERGRRLSRRERAWLAAQQASWLSIWEVLEVEPGTSVTLRDLLSGEERHVREEGASRALVVRDAMLGRVVDCDGVSLLCGAHPRPLPPLDAAEVVRRSRARLRRKRTVPVDRLRDKAIGRYLIRRWEEAVARVDERCAIPPDLRNTDGDALLLTIDHFEIASGAGPTVEARLAALKDVRRPEAGDDPSIYVFLRTGDARRAIRDDTLIGRALISDTTLQLETNSRKRADMLRERVEAACGDAIRHRVREHTDPLSSRAERAPSGPAPELSSPETEQYLLEFKRRHYADWIDHALPALRGATPREAIRTAEGRAAVDTLLKDMENRERRGAGGAAFDFTGIRRELGLE